MKTENIDLSIIIVNYKTKDLTLKCLSSLCDVKGVNDSWEVVLIDNASADGSVEAFEKRQKEVKNKLPIRIFQMPHNTGFAKANNKGIKESNAPFILLLNSDTEVFSNTIQHMLIQIQKHSVGACTSKLVLPDNSIDPACHRGFPTPWASVTYFLGLEKLFPRSPLFSQYHQGYKDINTVHEVDVISGAFFLVRKKVLEEVGLLDEQFFIYGEDIDLCFRIKQAGYKILFDPLVSALHKKKQSGRKSAEKDLKKQTSIYFYQTMQIFYKKHYWNKYPIFINIIIFYVLQIQIALIKFFPN